MGKLKSLKIKIKKFKFPFSFLLSFCLCQMVGVNIYAQTQINAISLENFSKFGNGLYRGARPVTDKNFNDFKKLQIKTIISLQGGDIKEPFFGFFSGKLEKGEFKEWLAYEKSRVNSMNINFVNVPINSLNKIDLSSGRALGRLLTLMSKPENQPIYIHCEHGIDRTGLVVALFRVFYQNWPKQLAYADMVAKGHNSFHQLFTDDMDRFFWAATADNP